MAKPELILPPRVSGVGGEELRAVCAAWAEDERLEGILFLGRPYLLAGGDAADVLVVASRRGHPARAVCRLAVGEGWLRLRCATYREFLREVQEGPATGLTWALRDAFIAFDRDGRVADVLRALEPTLKRELPRLRVAAAARVAAALGEAEAALAAPSAADAAAALARACSRLAELELLNEGAWPPAACPLAVSEDSPARRVFQTIWPAAGAVGKLAAVHKDASTLFRRYLPAATACLFDFLIRKGGSAALTSAVDALALADVPELDLVLNALRIHGLVKIGKEERPMPGLPGAVYGEPVLTLP
jgi:hypothetical protein